MPFGILECKRMEVVPGTAFMNDQDDLPQEYGEVPRERLKHGTGRYSNVILVPQPSDSPNDPLNVGCSPMKLASVSIMGLTRHFTVASMVSRCCLVDTVMHHDLWS
jgi:hypothetical protein